MPDALGERGPWYREPLDCDQALGDVIECVARGATDIRRASTLVTQRLLYHGYSFRACVSFRC